MSQIGPLLSPALSLMTALTLSAPNENTPGNAGEMAVSRKGNGLKTHLAKVFFSLFGRQTRIPKSVDALTFHMAGLWSQCPRLSGCSACSLNTAEVQRYVHSIATRTGIAVLGITLHFRNCTRYSTVF